MIQHKSKYSPPLSYWNPDQFPYYVVSINKIKKGRSTNSYLSEQRNDTDEILFVTSGSASIRYYDHSRERIDCLKIQENDIVFSKGGTYCELYDPSDDFEFYLFRFTLYTCDTLHSQSTALNLSEILSSQISHSRIYIDIPLITKIDKNSRFSSVASELVEEYVSKVTGYQMQVQTLLLQLLLMLLRNHSREFDDILRNANLIGISSKYSPNTAMPANCILTVSDIEILPKNPNNEIKSSPLSIYRTDGFSKLKDSNESVTCSHDYSTAAGQNTLTISSESESSYHIWMYPRQSCFTPDLRAYREEAYIRFFAKCNINMTFGLVIYNHDIHKCISHNFYIEASEGFSEFCVPLISTGSAKKMHQYVYDILDYIDKNYHTKLKLEDLAEYVHLTPSYLSKVFKEQIGISLSDHILKRRLNAAILLLKKNDSLTINEIALETGFYDSAHFSKAFKSVYGITALQYKNNYIKNKKK